VNGKPTLTDLVAKDPNGVAQAYVWQKYTCLSMTGLYDWERELSPALSEDALAAGEIWDRNWSDSISMPDVSIRSSESQEYSTIITDVSSYVREMVVKFIIGTEPLNAFDDYVEKCKSLGIDRATAIQQAAYTRFMAR
jgi:putative aldouronate transport system substrate-binding protein